LAQRLASQEDEADVPEREAKPHHNIHVAVRCRGLLHQEARDGGRAIINVLGNYPAGYSRTVILEDPHTTAADDYLRINKSKERRYTFDEAFGEYASQQEVYERTTKALIGGVLEGFNATVFAYGATSAGKTHTMLGTPNEPGIMMRTLLDLFSEVAGQREDRVFEVKCSFLEVYNENIRDLFSSRWRLSGYSRGSSEGHVCGRYQRGGRPRKCE
jgi:kinesin family protein 18/19